VERRLGVDLADTRVSLLEKIAIETQPKGLFANYMDKISLRFGSDLVVAISAKPQA
jgi:hypothetical protein